MICPFCQAGLDPKSMSCPRCGAIYPGGSSGGAFFGLRLRTGLLGFFLLLVTALIAVTCIMSRLPDTGSSPDTRTFQAQRALLMMQQHQQATQNP